jgi:Ti-type conjugative transfer relaxase TraA
MFHLRAKIIGRSTGRSAAGASAYRTGGRNAAASAAYRAGGKLRDPNSGRMFDYSRKATIDQNGFGILYTEIMLPIDAPAWMADRQALIDAVEARETRADAQLFREIEISLPRELTFDQQRDLIRDFVQAQFVARGMIADLAIHDERASDGGRNPHAHILLTMRQVTQDGFGQKVRAWNSPALLREWREAWADLANERLAQFGHERRIDHRSHKDRDIDLAPDAYVGPSRGRGFDGVVTAERQEARNAAKQENAERIALDPALLIAAVAREKATFTASDLGQALRRATGLERHDPDHARLVAAALNSDAILAIASDTRGYARYATREMLACEEEMARAALSLARRATFEVDRPPAARLSIEQKQAYLHATQGGDLCLIAGAAGAGKTTALADIAEGFAQAGYRVRGTALAGVAAKNLADEAGIRSSTLASLFRGWDHRRDDGRPHPIAPLEQGDVLIVDEAGLIGSRDIRRLLVEADRAQAKVILVGDAQQLQAIEAGAAFRSLADTHGHAELRDVRRQREDWQREASQLFSQRRGAEAVAAYRKAGAVHAAESTQEAKDALIATWMADRDRTGSQLILAHSRTDVADLNDRARQALRDRGLLGQDVKVLIREQIRDETGEIAQRARRMTLAQGDRILFTRNDRQLGVQNGTAGTILALEESGQLAVQLADGRAVEFLARDYPYLALGYATTVHKAQGATYDRAYVLASAGLDAHLGYVAMTRHRESVALFHGRDQFRRDRDLDLAFMRQRPKDSTLDYLKPRKVTDRSREESSQRPSETDTASSHAPLTAADRIRQNVAARQEGLARSKTRDRSYGD